MRGGLPRRPSAALLFSCAAALCSSSVHPTLLAQTRAAAVPSPVWLAPYRSVSTRLIKEATRDNFAWQRLALLTDVAGHRLSGSPGLDRAIEWTLAEMTKDGLENVHAEPVMVPKWVRGSESAAIVEPARHEIAMLGLGGSVPTPPEGIQADVLVVRTFDELDRHATEARGKIVLFDVRFTSYGDSMRYRTDGPSRAARHGAVAALVRSIGPDGLRLPHTGEVIYAPGAPDIPAAAIASEDASRLRRMGARGRVTVLLKMEGHAEPDVASANVVGEIVGRERPNEVVVIGGHLDSWDVGAGAADDGGGCVVTWEALRLMRKLNLRPRRTVRVVLWTNEENGGRGGRAYRDRHRAELGDHVMMLESDLGVSRPVGFGVTGSDRSRQQVREIATLLTDLRADAILPAGEGPDIGPSAAGGRIPSLSLEVDASKYFFIHHTQADTVDKIDPHEMADCAAVVAVMTYVVADMPMRLGD